MKTLTIKITSLSLLLIGALALSGCNTTEGVGEDMEEAGEAVQDAAE
ncbi:MAG: entericidin A/B family lipoprotein [Verrucomicrobiota bacterium]